MDIMTAARLGGPEYGASLAGIENDYTVYPVWGEYTESVAPLSKKVNAWRVYAPGEQSETLNDEELRHLAEQYPAAWRPNAPLRAELFYIQAMHGNVPAQMAFRLHSGAYRVSAIYATDTETVRMGGEGAGGVLNSKAEIAQTAWRQMARTGYTTLLTVTYESHVCGRMMTETVAQATLAFVTHRNASGVEEVRPIVDLSSGNLFIKVIAH